MKTFKTEELIATSLQLVKLTNGLDEAAVFLRCAEDEGVFTTYYPQNKGDELNTIVGKPFYVAEESETSQPPFAYLVDELAKRRGYFGDSDVYHLLVISKDEQSINYYLFEDGKLAKEHVYYCPFQVVEAKVHADIFNQNEENNAN